jgi:hypothetical protein
VNDAIDRYLDRLMADLIRPGIGGLAPDAAGVRRAMSEVEAHLRDDQAAAVRSGLSDDRAADQAVESFGEAADIADRFRADGVGAPRLTLSTIVASGWLIGSIGLLTLGLSGMVAWAFGLLAGRSFVSGDPPGMTYTAARCAQYAQLAPGHPTCEAAATAHHFTETVGNGLAAGVLGLLSLTAFIGWRRYRRRQGRPVRLLPPILLAAAGVALFGVVAVTLLGLTAGQVGAGVTAGIGANLAVGVASAVAATIFLTVAIRAGSSPTVPSRL